MKKVYIYTDLQGKKKRVEARDPEHLLDMIRGKYSDTRVTILKARKYNGEICLPSKKYLS